MAKVHLFETPLLSFGDDEGVLKAIEETMETGQIFEGSKVKKAFTNHKNKQQYLEVWFSDELQPGSINTIIPGDVIQ